MHSLTRLIQALISSGHSRAAQQSLSGDNEAPKGLTSIRLRSSTRAYLQAQSDHLGISLSQCINMIIDGVVEVETTPVKNSFDTIYDRIMMLFDCHNIMPLDIRRMLSKYGATTALLKSRDDFLDLVTPEMITDLSNWFCVREQWLNGIDTQVCDTRNIRWYKNPEGMALEMIEEALLNKGLRVYVVKRTGVEMQRAEETDDPANRLDMGFIFETKRTVAGITFKRYQICEFQRWNYGKCRDDLKLIFKFLDRYRANSLYRDAEINFDGISFDDTVLDKLCLGKLLAAQISNDFYERPTWYPDNHLAGIDDKYQNMRFEQYIAGLRVGLSNTLKLNHTQFNTQEWTAKIHNQADDTYSYYSLHEALTDLANRTNVEKKREL